MYLSIFSDELSLDLEEAIPYFKKWGIEYIDLRGRIFEKALESLSRDELLKVRRLLDRVGLKVGCLESSVGKVHLPEDPAGIREQQVKLENLLVASEILDCRLLRCFHFWQGQYRPEKQRLEGVVLERVAEWTRPLVQKAIAGGLTVAFENCGASTGEIRAVMEALGEKTYIAWDPHNDWFSEVKAYGSEQAYIRTLAGISKVIHVKAELALPEGGQLLPWENVLTALKETGYNGPVSVETHAHELQNLKESIGEIEMNRRLVEHTSRLLNKIGGR